MTKIALILLLGLSSLVGIKNTPPDNQDWKILHTWQETPQGYMEFSASSTAVVKQCRTHPSAYIEFPTTIHSASQVMVGNVVVAATSSPDLKHARGFYGAIVIPCTQIARLDSHNDRLTWEVTSYTKYFAWFKYYPRVVEHYPLGNFFNETLNVQAAAVLLILCFLYLILFSGKISYRELFTLVGSNFFTAIYFIGNSAELMGLNIPMLIAHQLADAGLWIGFLFFIHLLYLEKLIVRWMNVAYKISVVIALLIITSATNGDVIQLGTTVPFIFTLMFILYAVISLIKKGLNNRTNLFQFIGLFCFLATNINDVLVVTGILQSIPVLSIGVVGSYVFILLSINERITLTYMERDQFKLLTEQLQQANEDLQKTQDELIKSEKMAVMGRAVDRIAHELNTPIYVARSASQSLQKQTEKLLTLVENRSDVSEETIKNCQQTIQTLIYGLLTSISRAAEMIRNFKKISTDQINVHKKEFHLLDYIKATIATMESFLKRKKIQTRVTGDNVALYSDPSLFHQIIQNLVANVERYAYDESGGVIEIQVTALPSEVAITFRDYGKGIPANDLPKIFDAFFTTGGGSGGTGLGLNIVYSNVTKQLQGTIRCESTEEQGTTFFITIPRAKERGNVHDANN